MHNRKPISEKQLAANRRNAQKSTGPRTARGRQIVSLNAVKHGLAGNFALLLNEDCAAWQSFCRELILEFAPATALELSLAQTIANDLWRLNRTAAIETNMFAAGVIEDDPDPGGDSDLQTAFADARTFFNHVARFGLLSLYEQRLYRSVHKNQAELRQMQNERRNAAKMAFVNRQLADTQAKTAGNGFVCANNIFERSSRVPALSKAA
jgi:hypothetical protein